jgi:CRP-like cAMP-binding protein
MLTMREDYSVSESRTPILPFQAKPLRPSTLAGYMDGAPLRGVEAKDHLFTEGETKTHVYQVVTGAVCLYKVLPDGRRQVIDFAYGGDLIGLGLGPVEACNAQATVATRVRCLPVSSLRTILRNEPAIAVKICEALTQELTAIRDHLVCVVQRSATERLVTFLLALSQRNRAKDRDPGIIELPMTRADIGDFLGLTIETVSRTFSKLKASGVLEIDQGTTIRLRDIAELRALADGAELV